MSGWNVPPRDAVPPSPGASPPPGVSMSYRPEEEDPERSEARAEWDEAAAEAEEHKSTEDLRRDADHVREALNRDVVDLKRKLSFKGGKGSHHRVAGVEIETMRRHPFTVAVAAAGAVTASVIGLKIARDHRKVAKKQQKHFKKNDRMARIGGKAAKWGAVGAGETLATAATELPARRRAARRMARR